MFKKMLVGLVVLSLCLGCKATAPVKTGAGEPRMPGKLYASLDGTTTDGTTSAGITYLPGGVMGTGTHFEVKDSYYLNITLDSTVPLHLRLESMPQRIIIHMGAASSSTSAVITLRGFPPLTRFYRHEEGLPDPGMSGGEFTTDSTGSYTFTEDISMPHLILIQPVSGAEGRSNETEGGSHV